MKKRIKWNNIIFLIINIYAIVISILALNNVKTLDRPEIIIVRLNWIILVCYIAMVMSSIVIRKYFERKGN